MQLYSSQLSSLLGPLLLVTDDAQHIRALGFLDYSDAFYASLSRQYGAQPLQAIDAPASIAQAMERYFAGELNAMDALPVALSGTDLQRTVWTALRAIPVGTTYNYRQLAQAAGMEQPRAAIAMGSINAANLIAMVVPCHRVIGSDGALKGYAWGVERKRWLLEHEGALLPQQALLENGFEPHFSA